MFSIHILNEYYPNWEKEAYLPPDLLKLCVEYSLDPSKPIRTYYKSGKLKSEDNVVHNRLNGLSMEWYENGSIKYIEMWREGRRVSIRRWNINEKRI